MKPQNFEERLIWYCLIGTYGIYVLALLIPLYSLLGWVLFLYLGIKFWIQQEDTPLEKRIRIPWVLWLWVICMPIIAIATVVAMDDWGMSIKDIIRGLIGWGIRWALLAVFPIAGCLNIRPQLIYRAVCIVCLHSLIFIPICYLAYLIHLPPDLYSSPIERLFQNGALYYTVSFYIYTEYSGELRLGLFAPWGPALGIVGSLYFFLASQEPNKRWRFIGVTGAIAMCVVSASRLALMAVPVVAIAVWILTNVRRPTILIIAGFVSFILGIFSSQLLRAVTDFKDAVLGARSDSTRVRAALVRIAFDRSKESPIWGHGTQHPGPKLVEHMPIGSHTTWGGLMFVHGIIGMIAFLVPMICTFLELLIKAQKSTTAKVGLSALLVLTLFSTGESLDALAYLTWPGWLLIGIALKGENKLLSP